METIAVSSVHHSFLGLNYGFNRPPGPNLFLESSIRGCARCISFSHDPSLTRIPGRGLQWALPRRVVSTRPPILLLPSKVDFSTPRNKRRFRGNAQSKDGVKSGREKYLDLEMEIFRFMENSGRPDVFPSRNDLIQAGRWDLVDSIQRQGGWLAIGWEDEEDDLFTGSSFVPENSPLGLEGSEYSTYGDEFVRSRPFGSDSSFDSGGAFGNFSQSWPSQASDPGYLQQFLGPNAISEQQDVESHPNPSLTPEVRELNEGPGSSFEGQGVGAGASPADVRSADVSGGAHGSQVAGSARRPDSSLLSQLDAATKTFLEGLGLGYTPWGSISSRPKSPRPEPSGVNPELQQENAQSGNADNLAWLEGPLVVQESDAAEEEQVERGLENGRFNPEGENGRPTERWQESEGRSGEQPGPSDWGPLTGGDTELTLNGDDAEQDSNGVDVEPSSTGNLEWLFNGVTEGVREGAPPSENGFQAESAAEVGGSSGLPTLKQETPSSLEEESFSNEESSASEAVLSGGESAEGSEEGGEIATGEENAEIPGTSKEEGGVAGVAPHVSQEGRGEGDAGMAAESEGKPARKGKPPNYWRDPNNLRLELRSAQEALGLPDDVIPSRNQLIGLRRWDIVQAVRRQGGFRKLAEGLGLEGGEAKKAPKEEPAAILLKKEPAPILLKKESAPTPPEKEPAPDPPEKEPAPTPPKEEPAPTPPKEEPPPPPPQPEPQADPSPLDRLLSLFGLGPKPRPETPKPEPEPPESEPETPEPEPETPEPESETPPPEPEASVSSEPDLAEEKEAEEEEEERKAAVEQSVAERLKASLVPEFWSRKRGRRRERDKESDGTAEEEELQEEDERDGVPLAATFTEIDTVAESPARSGGLMDRIRALEQSLVTTREALQHDREALLENREFLREVRMSTLDELSKVSDSLEFREDEMASTARALRRTQAEMRALAGSISSGSLGAPEAVDAILADPQNPAKNPEGAPPVASPARVVRVVWPHQGEEVELAGSFNGWTDRIRMEKSNAGVFIATLTLPPGRYEIKFIVDGVWRVDAQRLISYEDMNENNVIHVL